MCDSVVSSDFLVPETSRDAYVGAWWFETVIAGTEWDPVLFTKILNDCRPKLQQIRHSTSSTFSHMDAENTALLLFRQDKWPSKVF